MKTYLILLAGGEGQRLWPLSKKIVSKQFLPLLKDKTSLLQKIYGNAIKHFPKERVVVATSKEQEHLVSQQLGDDVVCVAEPARRNTYAAILLATSYIKEHLNPSDEDVVVVLPTDSLVDDSYMEVIKEIANLASTGKSKLVLMGIEAKEATDQYGYIVGTKGEKGVLKVDHFEEKPPLDRAQELIKGGALYNGGVFAFKFSFLLNKGSRTYNDILNDYEKIKAISFDYEVVQKCDSILAYPYKGSWRDLGSWQTLIKELKVDPLEDQSNIVINETDFEVLLEDVKDLLVVVTEGGILVTKKPN
ncbi:MAG: sugar phosphate nucleotidyltransferase [Sphaerochaetaceae bacterium]|jgi:mannose-1-phosphate guanylyltransferase